MSGLEDLIAASHKGKTVSAGRKTKIISHVKAQVPKEHADKVVSTATQVLNKKDSDDKSDDALVAEIKAIVKNGNYMVASGVDQLIEAAGVPAQVYTLSVNDSDGALWRLLEYLKKCGDDGHSVSFKIDEDSFGFDGDGADKIVTMDRDEAP